jgi:hypothetical protein
MRGVMRGALKILGLIALVLAAYVAFWFHQDDRARAEATAFCDSVAIGAPMSAAAEKLAAMPGVRHGFMKSEGTYFASFRGPIFNAYTCEFKIAGGKVASKGLVEPKD